MGATKSKNSAINLPESTLEQLRCWLCKGYLSCAPIRLLPEGNSICGRCATPNDGAPIYRQLAFESALSSVIFPCRFKLYGCPERILFSGTLDHERKCAYKPFACPSASLTACPWYGSACQVHQHFTQVHPSLTTPFAEFNLEVAQNQQQILMAHQDSVAFVIKYRYDGGTSCLNYDVKYVASAPLEASYKIRLVSNLNPELSVNLKGNKCSAYNPEEPRPQELLVDKFLDVLDKPSSLRVEISITLRRFDPSPARIQEAVNYQLLDTLRCRDCHNYLALPVFDSPNGSICSDCSVNHPECIQAKNEDLLKVISEANYPCRWRNCKFIGKGYYIRKHQLACKYYPYNCPSPHCKATLTLNPGFQSMPLHVFMHHGYEFFFTRIAYKTVFTLNRQKVMVTVKNNEVLMIKHSINDVNKYDKHTFSLQSFKAGLKRVFTAKLCFEHSHCKLKSKTFLLDNRSELVITAPDLPMCFRIDEKMTVVIEL